MLISGWEAPLGLLRAELQQLEEEGIEIPFPQMVVHHGSEVSSETQSQFYALKNCIRRLCHRKWYYKYTVKILWPRP